MVGEAYVRESPIVACPALLPPLSLLHLAPCHHGPRGRTAWGERGNKYSIGPEKCFFPRTHASTIRYLQEFYVSARNTNHPSILTFRVDRSVLCAGGQVGKRLRVAKI